MPAGCIVALACAALLACSSDRNGSVPQAPPGAPAYWESNVPHEPGSRFEEWPSTDSGVVPPNGSTDRFLWDGEPAEPPAAPESQIPLRSLERDAGVADGGPGF